MKSSWNWLPVVVVGIRFQSLWRPKTAEVTVCCRWRPVDCQPPVLQRVSVAARRDLPRWRQFDVWMAAAVELQGCPWQHLETDNLPSSAIFYVVRSLRTAFKRWQHIHEFTVDFSWRQRRRHSNRSVFNKRHVHFLYLWTSCVLN